MVNIGFLGDVSVGKTSLLRNFVCYLNKNHITELSDGGNYFITDTDFSGESLISEEKSITHKKTKTIHPNRVYFKEKDTGFSHTLFAPGGDRTRPVVRMGIITISRIAKQIVAVIALDRSVKKQLKFFNTIRYFPKSVYICFNKYDLLKERSESTLEEKQEINSLIARTKKFFNRRNIRIKDIFFTCAENVGKYKDLNDEAADMILKIASENVDSAPKQRQSQVKNNIKVIS
ncbi:MAG: hypothetical protein GF364_03995 [Candidatus Lokiarchaeota archaeon]|nr:hypothetical protein [Candidatus Lokiarchaeota archaeon]